MWGKKPFRNANCVGILGHTLLLLSMLGLASTVSASVSYLKNEAELEVFFFLGPSDSHVENRLLV